MHKSRIISIRPKLNVCLRTDRPKLGIIVENIGAGVAINGKIKCEGSQGAVEYSFTRLFASPVEPWQDHYPTGDWSELPVKDTNKEFSVIVECEDLEGRRYGPEWHKPKMGKIGLS
ncbi:MAG: hypothetical protein E3J65_02510 [Dehalococcoidia bacterium]|nr:MAG: hypothetical protein E3J65_02510 [Dehalococcoidia bacterium]